MVKGVHVIEAFLQQRVGWKTFRVVEGSGLSRANRVTPREMTTLIRAFKPYHDLLPAEEVTKALVKTGTLNGVNTIVGVLKTRKYGEVYFSFLVNSEVPFTHKFQLTKELASRLSQ